MSARLGLKGIPAEAEEIMAIRDILLARRTGGHVHLCHMSTRGSVELIRWGKERGINVTAEVCPHHISLTEDAVEGYDTNAKMNPPLRTADDVAALQEAVRDGTIDLIATDHAPHHYDEKEREFADAPNGIVGLETALAVNITWLVAPGIIDLPLLIERMSCAPARVFKLPGGTLRRGARRRRHGVRPDSEMGRRAVAVQVEGTQHAVRRDRRFRDARAARSSAAASRIAATSDAATGRRRAGRLRRRRSSASAGVCTSAGWSPVRTATSRFGLQDGSILVTPSGMSKVDVEPGRSGVGRSRGPGARRQAAARRASCECICASTSGGRTCGGRPCASADGDRASPSPASRSWRRCFRKLSCRWARCRSCRYATPGTDALADSFEPFLDGHDAFLMANHGATTVGADARGRAPTDGKSGARGADLLAARTLVR